MSALHVNDYRSVCKRLQRRRRSEIAASAESPGPRGGRVTVTIREVARRSRRLGRDRLARPERQGAGPPRDARAGSGAWRSGSATCRTPVARSLITRRTHTLGVLLPDLYGEFFSEVIRGIDLSRAPARLPRRRLELPQRPRRDGGDAPRDARPRRRPDRPVARSADAGVSSELSRRAFPSSC